MNKIAVLTFSELDSLNFPFISRNFSKISKSKQKITPKVKEILHTSEEYLRPGWVVLTVVAGPIAEENEALRALKLYRQFLDH